MTSTPITTRRRRDRRPNNRSPVPFTAAPLLLLLLLLLLGLLTSLLAPITTTIIASAEEIVATSEWTKLGPDDTVPAGLHVRIDMTTGEKWAKLIDENDGDDGEAEEDGGDGGGGGAKKKATPISSSGGGKPMVVDEVVIGSDGSVGSSVSAAVAVAQSSGGGQGGGDDSQGGDAQTGSGKNNKGKKDGDDTDEESSKQFDYEMMHRTLSKLPDEEIERMGGLPALPESNKNDLSSSNKAISPEERKIFEERMAAIWKQRQEEIHMMQEEFMADLPKMLLQRIKFVGGYLDDPVRQREELLEVRRRNLADSDSSEAEEDADAAATVVSDIVAVLKDVEYHVSDVDHARDFHTLGGWPVLVSLLSDVVHFPSPSGDVPTSFLGNETDADADADRDLVDEIQAAAAWAVGTAVKNHDEFSDWSVEDLSDAFDPRPDGPVTVVSLLLSNLRDHHHVAPGSDGDGDRAPPPRSRLAAALSRRQMCLYALGSLLRGNRAAVRHFLTDLDGPAILGSDLPHLLSSREVGGTKDAAAAASTAVADVKFASKVLALADDLITDVLLHGEGGATADDDDRLIRSLTTEPWCRAAVGLSGPSSVTSVPIRERALNAVRTMVPYCDFGNEGRDVVRLVGAELRGKGEEEEGGGDGGWSSNAFMDLDPSYRAELVVLVDSVLKEMGNAQAG